MCPLRRSQLPWLACLVCLGLLGCSATADRDAGDQPQDGAVPPEPEAGARDAGPSQPREPTPVPTTITLENTGSEPFVVGSQCGGSFLSLAHDGQNLTFDRSCACACDAAGACGCGPACRDTQQLVVPGEHASVEWDGLFARFDEPACYQLAGLSRGDVVSADACWSLGLDDAASACEGVEFAYDETRAVTIGAEHHSAARTPATIVLDNQTGGAVEIVTDSCGVQSWFRLALADQPGATLSRFCPCSCSADFELEPGSCPVCGGCAEDVIETVEAGATRRFEWDGMFWYVYESGCANRYPMPAGFALSAEVCFTPSGAGAARTCQPLRFVLGESDEVRATLR